ncbi:alpha/beta hydrolase family protein [Alteromonas oceanisediminis]|uniref:alpha/beta hydrolase family protein n=1 Tax=Alteromonas oceanisediminis TaxID=2836180 RepID=UPI001BD9C63D|nr:prolyl oligopeptidase family serine peptidase [Alteromonas oceanisediminis]MBT0586214.1 prolyl oligopeptidase family serine peptidase [Alteromonas oceanisediminis]
MNGHSQRFGVQLFRLIVLVLVSLPAIADPLPVSSFSQLPQFERPSLSPSGERVAFIQNIDGENPLSVLSAVDLNSGERFYLLQSDNESIKINWYRWANDETLIISARYESRHRTTKYYSTRLFAMEYDDLEATPRLLIKPRRTTSVNTGHHISQFQDNVIDWLPDDPEHIMVAIDLDRQFLPSVYKLNIYSTRTKRVEKGKREVRDWLTDQQHHLRVGIATDYSDGEKTILVRRTPEADWDELFRYNSFEDAGIRPVGFGLDPNLLYYRAYKDDKLALFTWDLRDDNKTEMFSDTDYDVNGRLLYSPVTRDVIGVSHSHSKLGRVYWEPRYEALHNSVEKLFPDTDNYFVSFNQTENAYILYTENDFTPGTYYLGNREKQTLGKLFEQYPDLKTSNIEHKLVSYQARDGIDIEGYLTLPNGQGPFPTILHPHGGPGARDYDGFDYWTSFFVNRGYAVFRPNFRGSSGYGYEFAQSQMQSWGLAMQDDLTDAAHWLVKQGVAEAGKMCIVGASYGGYATLMAAVKTPDLFACGVSFAGVSSLNQLLSTSRRFLNKKFVRNQIGDDSDDLRERSPYEQAEKVSMPLLLVHGEEDRVVSVRQSRMFAEELEDLDKNVEYIELPNGDHYLSIQRNRHTFFQRMDTFLKAHLTK